MSSVGDPTTPNSSTGSDSTTDDDNDVCSVEKLLPNGDFYTGQWSNDFPHGNGKYLWTDGCMYEGEWQNGKPMGTGKFSWPSGATYEGEFKNGYMEGSGTYIGTCGATYRGTWSMNLKHGQGMKSYANGDYYDGEWRSGQQEGYGRYLWKNGNEYVGHWKCGVIHGRGTLVWANGNKYDGGWEDGLPRGNGSFRWADGSLYIGFWSKEGTGTHQKGVYYPSASATSPTARDPNESLSTDLVDCKVSPGETVSVLPSQKMINWSGTDTDFMQKQAIWRTSKVLEVLQPWRRSSVDATTAGGGTPTRRLNAHMFTNTLTGIERFCMWDSEGDRSGENGGGEEGGFETMRYQPTPLHLMKWSKESKQAGETISKGNKNYDLMLNLQLGIRYLSISEGMIIACNVFDLCGSFYSDILSSVIL